MPYKKAEFCHIRMKDPDEFEEKIVSRGPSKGKKRKFYTLKATSKRVKELYSGKKYKRFFDDESLGAKVRIGKSKKSGKTEIQVLLIPNKHCKGYCEEGTECRDYQ